MRNGQLKTNNNAAALNVSFFCLLTVLFLVFSFSACDTPSTPRLPTGTGSVTLIIDGLNGRTILPDSGTNVNIFTSFTLELFAPGTTSPVLYTFERPKATTSYTIVLDTGTYDLRVSAWKGAGKTELAAQGWYKGMVVDEAVNNTYNVKLEALMNSGEEGSFRWVIVYPNDLSSASMTITPVNSSTGTEEEIIPIPVTLGQTFLGSRTLNVGYYTVTFELKRKKDNQEDGNTNEDYQEIIFHEILHVYQNLESYYSYQFSDNHFSAIKYNVTFVYDDGTTPDLSENKWHGDKIKYEEPLIKKPIPAGLYQPTPPPENKCTFNGWYVSGKPWDFNDPVTGNMTLTAHWTAANLVDVSAEAGNNDVTKAVNYAKNNPDTYTLLIGASDPAANTSVNIGNHTLGAGCYLTIRGMGDGERGILGASANSPLFTINGAGAGLTLGSGVTLYGIANGTKPLVDVTDGSLIMEAGSKITGHTTSSPNGAVCIGYSPPTTSTVFTMKGGEITRNRSTSANTESAGGVYAGGSNVTMRMEGGSINRNTVSSSSRPGDVLKENGSPLNLSGDAEIWYLTLRSTGSTPGANAVVNIASGWSGKVNGLNLYATIDTIAEVMTRWENQPVLQGTVNADNVAKFPLGNFMTSSSGAIQAVGNSHYINTGGILIRNSFPVTFNSNGGGSVAGQTIFYDYKVLKPADPARTGFIFDGWYKEAAFINEWNFATDTITGPTTIYAKWLAGQGISFEFYPDTDKSPIITTGVIIHRSGANGLTTASLTISNFADFMGAAWYYNSAWLADGPTITLNSSDVRYNMIGTKFITVEAWKNDIPYSTNVEFEVKP